MDEPLEELKEILNLRTQELNILLALHKLELMNERTNPKNISKEYTKISGKRIHDPNLFKTLRNFLDQGIAHRESRGDYGVNIEKLREEVEKKKIYVLREVKKLDESSNKLEEYLRKASLKILRPIVEYMSLQEFNDSMAHQLKTAKYWLITAKFPGIAYTMPVYNEIGRGHILRLYWERCFEKKELKVTYLSALDIDYPFTHALRTFQNKKKAYRETRVMIEQLRDQIRLYRNLNVYYMPRPYGIDIVLPQYDELTEFYQFIRDENMNAIGGIYIRHPETAKQVRERFLLECNEALKLDRDNIEEIQKKLKRDLKELANP